MRSTRIGKKGQIDEMLVNFLNILFIIYVVVITTAVYFIYTEKKIAIEDAELGIVANRMVREVSTYDKDTGRTYVGMIDPDKGNEIDDQIAFGNEVRIGAAIQMENSRITYQQKWLDRLKPRVGYDAKKIEKEVFLLENGYGKPAKIEAVQ